jgi:hypothetical protein
MDPPVVMVRGRFANRATPWVPSTGLTRKQSRLLRALIDERDAKESPAQRFDRIARINGPAVDHVGEAVREWMGANAGPLPQEWR